MRPRGTALWGGGGDLILTPCCAKSPGSSEYNVLPQLLLAACQTENQDLQNAKHGHLVGLISQCLQVSKTSSALFPACFAPLYTSYHLGADPLKAPDSKGKRVLARSLLSTQAGCFARDCELSGPPLGLP